jgi:hypothetical protein
MTPAELTAFTESLKVAKEYAGLVFKPAISEFGGILSDSVGFWRLKNKINILLKAKKFLEERGVDPQKLLPDVFVPLLEEGGNTEDETLSDIFARLMAAHLEDDDSVHPSFAKIVGQMSPLDAKMLR